jgi:Phytanoyl-CoA dioxygenase (PhyH)
MDDLALRPPNARERVMGRIRELGLTEHVVELESEGYTILRGVLSDDHLHRARTAIIRKVEALTGRKVDAADEDGALYAGMQYIPYLLYADPVFEEIMMAPGPLALITYLLGESCLLSSVGCHFRGPGGAPLMMHSDNGNGQPPPFSHTAFVANINYALTPYTRENGALVMVPGSHKRLRQPTEAENFRQEHGAWAAPEGLVTMEIDPGDAVIWHGNTWHGSYVRTNPGVRMNLAVYFCRQFVRTQEEPRPEDRAAVLARHDNDPRMAVLLGAKQPYGWQEQGPDYSLMARNPRGLYD